MAFEEENEELFPEEALEEAWEEGYKKESKEVLRYFSDVAEALAKLITRGRRIAKESRYYRKMLTDYTNKLRKLFREAGGNIGYIKAEIEFFMGEEEEEW